MANARIGKLMTLVALVSTFGLLLLEQSTSAESPSSSCKPAKGDWFDAPVISGTAGIITNGGILNGPTETLYNPASVFTPDPTVVSYVGELTITTIQGQLKTSNVYIFNVATGLWTAMGRINADTSTGRFAGATGVLYFNGKTVGAFESFPSAITAEICFADQ